MTMTSESWKTYTGRKATDLGVRMEAWRKELGFTQKEASQLFTPPLKDAMWSQYVYGRSRPSADWLKQFDELCAASAPVKVTRREPMTEANESPLGDGEVRTWEWVAQTVAEFDEPESVNQSARATVMQWATKRKDMKVRLVLVGTGRVISPVERAEVEFVRAGKCAQMHRADSVEDAHRVMRDLFAEAASPQPGLDLLLRGIIAICAAAQYKASKPRQTKRAV